MTADLSMRITYYTRSIMTPEVQSAKKEGGQSIVNSQVKRGKSTRFGFCILFAHSDKRGS